MTAVKAPAKILVTGASGFIAVWVVRELLEHGFTVVGTVRSDSKGQYLKKQFSKYGDKFSFVIVEDVGKEGAFDDAIKGIDAVAHTASPFHTHADEPSELIEPAVDGTVGVLKSIAKHGQSVKRVVVTSSIAAINEPKDKPYVFTEADWNNSDPKKVEEKGRDAEGGSKYQASKTLAEHAAWDFLEKNKSNISFDLATINPGYVFGPFIHEVASPDKLNTSVALVRQTLFEKTPSEDELAQPAGSWVDVRDVAAMHVAALELEKAHGERFIASAGPFTWQEILDALHQNPDIIPKVTKGKPGNGKKPLSEQTYASGEKATKVLGIKFKTLNESLRDTVKALQERGWAEAK